MIIRRKQTTRYAALPNAIWEDPKLSVEAKGVLGYLLSRPADWNVHLSHVGKVLVIGKDRLQRIFRELIDAGYVSRECPRAETGVFAGIEYVVRDEAKAVADEVEEVPPDIEGESVALLPQPEKPEPVQPAPANTAAYKVKKELSTEITKSPYPSSNSLPAPAEAVAQPPQHVPRVRSETIQAQIAERLGNGDAAEGWLLLGELTPSKLDQITAQQRSGRLTEEGLAMIRLDLMRQVSA